jgi:MYXO-CTERM domain-containing protein
VRPTTAALALTLVAWAGAPAARADQCGKPDLVDMVPPDGATGVPLNATLGAHYTAAAEYLGEDVVLERLPAGPNDVLPAAWDPTEQLLSVTPAAPLDAGAQYMIHWPALRGLNAAAPGVGGDAKFTAGSTTDVAPPTFAGVVGVSWDLERVTDDCLDDLVERFVFDVQLGAASDDGGTSGLTLMLFQTMGPQVMMMPTPVPARAWPQTADSAAHAKVKLAKDAAVGEICFAGIVRDTAGHLSASNNAVACVQTTAPPFFDGCSIAAADAPAGTLPTALALLALYRRRRR